MYELITVVSIAVTTAIVFMLGVAAAKSRMFNPKVFTLVIERYMADFEESTYEVRKYLSEQDREEYIDWYTNQLLHDDYTQQGHALVSESGSYYVVCHEID